MDYPHLLNNTMRARQALAAFYLAECVHVLEVGGWKTPVDEHLARMNSGARVTCVDPFVDAAELRSWGRVYRRLRCGLETYEAQGDEDALCMLGFEGFRHVDRDCVLAWCGRVRRIVVEASAGHAPAQQSIGEICALPAFRTTTHITLHCRGEGIPIDYRFGVREFRVLQRA